MPTTTTKPISAAVIRKVTQLLEEQASMDVTEITPQALLREDLNMDSLDIVEFAMDCEAHFHIEISDEDMEKVSTVNDAFKLIARLTK